MTRNSVVRGLHNPVCLWIVGLYNVVSPRTISPYLKICLLRFGRFGTSPKPNHQVLQFFRGLFSQVYGCTLPAAATQEAVSFPANPVAVVYQFCQFNCLPEQRDNIYKTCFLGIFKIFTCFLLHLVVRSFITSVYQAVAIMCRLQLNICFCIWPLLAVVMCRLWLSVW